MNSSIYRFLKYNHQKKLTLSIWVLSGYYRAQMLLIPSKKLQKGWGKSGEESSRKATNFQYSYAYRVSKEVYRITQKTPWESKCLVQALTARFFLCRKGIESTLYLGVGKDDKGQMIAHAWLRVGEFYVTGGNGSGYACVAKFCK